MSARQLHLYNLFNKIIALTNKPFTKYYKTLAYIFLIVFFPNSQLSTRA